MNRRNNTASRAFRVSKAVRSAIIRADYAVFAVGDKAVTSITSTFRDLRAGWREAKVDDIYDRVIKPAAARAAVK